jgi:predicted nucleic acid-binding protein
MGLSEVREYCKLDDAGKVLGRWEIATTMASNLLDLVPVVYPVLEADVRRAVELFREYAPQGVTIRDVLHAAVMQNNGIAQIISTDEHFDRIEGITRLDPRTLFGLAHRKPS